MNKIVFSFVIATVVFATVFALFIVNPNDAQYKSYYLENQALKALSNKNIDKYFDDMDNPVSVKYHQEKNYTLSKMYVSAGKYDNAKKVIDSFEKSYDYSYCMAYKPAMRFICRGLVPYSKSNFSYDKNKNLSFVYFEKGDYKKSIEYYKKSENSDSCFATKLYAASNDMNTAERFLKFCKIEQNDKKYPRRLYSAQGYLYLKQNKYEKAEAEFKKDLSTTKCGKENFENCRGNNTTYLYLAECYKENGKIKKAAELYKKILFNEPWHFKAKNGLKSIEK